MPANESVVIRPARNLLGSIRVPGDKSISHRYAMLAALAPGRSRFENYSPGADCNSTLGCVRALGCTVEREETGAVVIEGIGPQLQAPSVALDCGHGEVVGHRGGATFYQRAGRRRVALAAAHEARDGATAPDGCRNRRE